MSSKAFWNSNSRRAKDDLSELHAKIFQSIEFFMNYENTLLIIKYTWWKLLHKYINWIYWFLTLIAKKRKKKLQHDETWEAAGTRQKWNTLIVFAWSQTQLNDFLFNQRSTNFLRWSMSRDERFRSTEKRNLYYPRHWICLLSCHVPLFKAKSFDIIRSLGSSIVEYLFWKIGSIPPDMFSSKKELQRNYRSPEQYHLHKNSKSISHFMRRVSIICSLSRDKRIMSLDYV